MCLLLLIRDLIGRNTMRYKHILVAVDLSKSSEVVISKAVSLAREAKSKLSFIYVDASYASNIGYASTVGLVKPAVDKVEAAEKEKALLQKELQALVDQVDYPITNTLVVMGKLNDKLNTTVKEMDVDLVVCGHHHDFWSRLLSSVPKLVNSTITDLLIIYLDK